MLGNKKMHIALIYNVRHVKAGLGQQAQEEAEFDEPETIAAIHDAIVANGYECTDIETNEDAYGKLKKLKKTIDLVFNFSEGLRGEMREAQMPAILEMLGLPYTHSGALAQAIALDKSLTKKVWLYHGLPTPKYVIIGPNDKPYVNGLMFPVIVKPNSEGSSKGVFNDNLVTAPDTLVAKIRATRAACGNGVIVEEYMPGREFTVTVMGNPGVGKGVYILPIVEINFDVYPKDMGKFESFEAKWFLESTLTSPHDIYICPAQLARSVQTMIETMCIKAFLALGCRDIARIDLRMDARGKPHLLEINTIPGMIGDPNVVTYYPAAARAAGWDYNRIVGQIITHARERLGI